MFILQGEIIELPNVSTPIDFAYRINKNIENTMIGALMKINMLIWL